MLICSPAAVTSQYKIINCWIPFLHRSIMLSPLRYLNEKNAMFNQFLPTIIWVAYLSQICPAFHRTCANFVPNTINSIIRAMHKPNTHHITNYYELISDEPIQNPIQNIVSTFPLFIN